MKISSRHVSSASSFLIAPAFCANSRRLTKRSKTLKSLCKLMTAVRAPFGQKHETIRITIPFDLIFNSASGTAAAKRAEENKKNPKPKAKSKGKKNKKAEPETSSAPGVFEKMEAQEEEACDDDDDDDDDDPDFPPVDSADFPVQDAE